MDLEQMRTCKRLLGYSNETIARLSGVPLGTVRKVMCGKTKNPRQKTIEALSEVLEKGRADSMADMNKPSGVQEAAGAYNVKKSGYTIEDIFALPDEVWAELIDGQIYYMSAPTRTHQRIAGEMHLAVANYIKSKGGDCEVYIPPFGVYLFGDDSTYVLPDLVVVCDPSKLEEKGCVGAPDWVVEVVSPSSGKMDYSIKLDKYRKSGVREYWAINSKTRIVLIYRFSEGGTTDEVSMRSFDEKIQVGIYPDLTICLSDMLN